MSAVNCILEDRGPICSFYVLRACLSAGTEWVAKTYLLNTWEKVKNPVRANHGLRNIDASGKIPAALQMSRLNSGCLLMCGGNKALTQNRLWGNDRGIFSQQLGVCWTACGTLNTKRGWSLERAERYWPTSTHSKHLKKDGKCKRQHGDVTGIEPGFASQLCNVTSSSLVINLSQP